MNPIPQMPQGNSPFPGFPTLDIGGVIGAFRKNWWIAGAVFGGIVVLALVYVLFAKKIYQSSAVIYVEPENVLSDNLRGVRRDDVTKLDALKSLEANIVSGTVILQVIEKHDLRNDAEFIKPKPSGEPYSDAELVEIVGKRVKSALRRGTRLIDVVVEDRSPERARLLAQAFVDEFEAVLMQQNLESTQKATEMLENQAKEQLKRVGEVEDLLQAFREKHADVPLEDGGIIEQKLQEIDRQLSEAKNRRLHLQAEMEELETIPAGQEERILEIGSYVMQEHIGKLLLARNQKRAEFAKIQNQYEPASRTYQDYVAEIDGFDAQVKATAVAVGESIRKNYGTAVELEQKLKESVDAQKREVLALDGVRKEFRSLKQNVDAAYATYQALLSRINETDVSEGVRESIVRLVEKPLVPSKPAKPKKTLTVALAGIFGGAMGCGVVILLFLLDRSLRTRHQIEQTLGLPVLSEIAQGSEDETGEDLGDSLVVFSEPHSVAAESFRALRMSLSTFSPRSILLTSAMPGEGKSFCAANLALLQAQLGYRTLLVDADFRRPSLSKALLGFSGIGAQSAAGGHALEAQNVCQKTPFPNLYLITCARFAPNTGEIMNGELFAAMLWEAYRSFDAVIIDSSPLGVVSDALNFARYADMVALVVRAGVTQTGDAQNACRELRRMRVPLAGCILNGVSDPERAKAYFETYSPSPVRKPVLSLGMAH
ncbi:MAG: hypothetical protein H7A53_08540 [Akkermansiaceae bacterium]|nr:hypothetical protein [Akkermansiaceae bacterium]MCP5550924.1 hypothetical protein [Akkermansiaceae bacterium]